MLDAIAGQLDGPPRGGLYYACVGRGEHMFGRRSAGAGIIRERLGDFPARGVLLQRRDFPRPAVRLHRRADALPLAPSPGFDSFRRRKVMPKAIRFHKTGGPEVLVWEDVEVGDPGPGRVRIRQHAVGLNFVDVYQRSGLYQMPLPSGTAPKGRASSKRSARA